MYSYVMCEEDKILIEQFINSGLSDGGHYVRELKESPLKYRQRLWEARLYDYLLPIFPTSDGYEFCSEDVGPDFVIKRNQKNILYIEAVAPDFCMSNQLSEHVVIPECEAECQARQFNEFESGYLQPDKYLERWSTGIASKIRKFKHYKENSVIDGGVPCVIAISNECSDDATSFSINPSQPWCLQYLFDVSLLEMDGQGKYVSRDFFEKTRDKGEPGKIETGVFLDEGNSCVSAVWAFDVIGGGTQVLIHNPFAEAKEALISKNNRDVAGLK